MSADLVLEGPGQGTCRRSPLCLGPLGSKPTGSIRQLRVGKRPTPLTKASGGVLEPWLSEELLWSAVTWGTSTNIPP